MVVTAGGLELRSVHRPRLANSTDGAGTAMDGGASAEEDCASGYYSDAGATICTQAQAGKFTTDGAGTAMDGGATAEEDCASGGLWATIVPEPRRDLRSVHRHRLANSRPTDQEPPWMAALRLRGGLCVGLL